MRALVVAVVAAASVALAGAPAQACTGGVCDTINYVCSLGGGGGCIP